MILMEVNSVRFNCLFTTEFNSSNVYYLPIRVATFVFNPRNLIDTQKHEYKKIKNDTCSVRVYSFFLQSKCYILLYLYLDLYYYFLCYYDSILVLLSINIITIAFIIIEKDLILYCIHSTIIYTRKAWNTPTNSFHSYILNHTIPAFVSNNNNWIESQSCFSTIEDSSFFCTKNFVIFGRIFVTLPRSNDRIYCFLFNERFQGYFNFSFLS